MLAPRSLLQYLMSRAITVVFIGIVVSAFGTKKQTGDGKNSSQNQQDRFDIHNQYIPQRLDVFINMIVRLFKSK